MHPHCRGNRTALRAVIAGNVTVLLMGVVPQGASARQGKRTYMEDRHVIVPCVHLLSRSAEACSDTGSVCPDFDSDAMSSENSGVGTRASGGAAGGRAASVPPSAVVSLTMVGVFDGHGGSYTAEFAAKHFGHILARELHRGDDSQGGTAVSPLDCLRAAFECCDAEFISTHPSRFRTGSTGIVVLLDTHVPSLPVLHIAHAGDSRAVLCRGRKAIRLVRCAVDRMPVYRVSRTHPRPPRVRGLIA